MNKAQVNQAQETRFMMVGAVVGAATSYGLAYLVAEDVVFAVVSGFIWGAVWGNQLAAKPKGKRLESIVDGMSCVAFILLFRWLLLQVWPIHKDCSVFICLAHLVLSLTFGITSYYWVRQRIKSWR